MDTAIISSTGHPKPIQQAQGLGERSCQSAASAAVKMLGRHIGSRPARHVLWSSAKMFQEVILLVVLRSFRIRSFI